MQRRLRRAALGPGVQVALTPTIERELAAVGLRERVEIIPTPVDLSVFRPPDAGERRRARTDCGLADDEYIVLYAGLLRERKRVERLVEAVGALRATDARIRLLVVGGSLGGEEDVAEALYRQVADGGLGDVVEFVGPVDDVRPYLWAADVFVLPSDREGLPNSLQEAMACGVPCVAPRSAAGHEVMGARRGRRATGEQRAGDRRRDRAVAQRSRARGEDPGRRTRAGPVVLARAGRRAPTRSSSNGSPAQSRRRARNAHEDPLHRGGVPVAAPQRLPDPARERDPRPRRPR